MIEREAAVTHHWRVRVRERLGPDVDAEALANAIVWEIDHDTGHVDYLGRVSRCGKRAYRFKFSETICGAAILVLGESRVNFITLFEPGWRLTREGKASRKV